MTGKHPGGRPSTLTPVVQKRITDAIRKGAWDYIAAEVAGIADSTFYAWLERGRQDPKSIYGQFAEAVRSAKAEARFSAERRVLTTRPTEWLRMGPGREQPGRPGWSDHRTIEGDVNVGGGLVEILGAVLNSPDGTRKVD